MHDNRGMRIIRLLNCLPITVLGAVLGLGMVASAQQLTSIPAAITADPAVNKEHPATMQSFQILSHGEKLNAIAYLAAGEGPHPVVFVLHGFPGNEKNLDLAQSIRRAGWNAIYFNYRGSWGTPGVFSFGHAIEDTQAAIAWVREPANAAKLHSDPTRIAVVGHSMGGFMAAYAGSHDQAILGTALISAANFFDWAQGSVKDDGEKASVDRLSAALEKEDILPLAGCTGASLATEMLGRRKEWNFRDYVGMFGLRPMLVITSDDGLAPSATSLASLLKSHGNTRVTEQHFATDHSYSDQRIGLQAAVLRWLGTL